MKTRPHKRTIITSGIIALISLVGLILSFFISYLIVEVLSIIVCVCFIIACAFTIVREYITYLLLETDESVLNNNLIYKGLFRQKKISISEIKRIEKTMSSYNFIDTNDKVFVSIDIDLVNLKNIVEKLKNEFNIKVYIVE